jgi:small conductance mechanosensitive channel
MLTKPLVWDRLNVEVLLTQFVAWLPSLLSAIIIFFVFWGIFRVTRPALGRILSRGGFDPALAGMLQNVYRLVVLTFGTIMAVNQLGINVAAALAGLGVIGLTIGFAAKDTLSNVMAGFLIFLDKPFHAGDWISIGDNYGKVVDVTMRTTRLLAWNNTSIIIPNETVINQVLVNHSATGRTRIDVPVTINGKGDLNKTQEAIVKEVRQVEGILDNPPPAVVVKSLSGSTMDLLVHAWIADAAQERPVFSRILQVSKPIVDAAA